MAKSRTKNSLINVMTSTGLQLCSTILKFIVRTVFIHTLGKQFLGVNGLFSDILTMLSLTELGFDTAINFKLYKPLVDKDEKRIRVLMKFYKQAYRVVGAVILILGISLIPLLPVLIKDYDSLEVLGINAVVIFMLHIFRTVSSYLFFAYRSALIKADQKKYILDLVDILVEIANAIAKILVLVFLKDFMLYTATVIFFTILKNGINAFISHKMYPHIFQKEEESISKEEFHGLLKDCGALFLYKVNNVVLKATDNMVLSYFLGLPVVGIYSNYLLLFNTLRQFLSKFYLSVKASTGNLFATASMETKYKFFQTMNYITVVLYGTAGVGLAVCTNELIHVWAGEDYVVPQPFPILIGIELLTYGLMNNLGQIRNVTGAFRQMWHRPLLGIFINIISSVIFVQFIGIYGVILGTITAVSLTNLIVDPVVIHKYSFENYKPVSGYYKRNLVYIMILALVGAGNLYLSSCFFVGYGWISVIVHAAIVAITVPGVFVLLYWKTEENQYLLGIAKSLLKKFMKKHRS